VAAAWTVRSHTLKEPRAARTARGGRIGDLREIFTKKYIYIYKIPIFSYFCTGWTGWSVRDPRSKTQASGASLWPGSSLRAEKHKGYTPAGGPRRGRGAAVYTSIPMPYSVARTPDSAAHEQVYHVCAYYMTTAKRGGSQITLIVSLRNRVNLCDCESQQNIGSVENSGR
jgi:hypothetical protein